MVGMLACFSVLALYVETILQLYILTTAWAVNTLQDATFLLLLVLLTGAFIASSIVSAITVFSAFRFGSRTAAKVLCACMHVVQLGFVWRLYRVLFFYEKRDWYELTGLRLVHVSFQTIPYVILYGRLLVVDEVFLQPLPVVSVVASLVSGTVALCTYTLRHRLHEALLLDCPATSRTDRCSGTVCWAQPSKPRRYIGLFLLLLASALCLTSRLGAFALMSVEHTYWTLIPFGVHFFVLLVIHFGCFRIRSEKTKTPIWQQAMTKLAKAYLGTFELVEDNFQRIQCRYVSFYSVLLVENLVMTAFWMLFSPMAYVGKLLVAVGLLAMFLCALVIKFASCSLIIPKNQSGTAPDPTDLTSVADLTRDGGPVINGRYGPVINGSRHAPVGRVSSTSGSKQSVSVATISSHSRDVVCSDHSHHHLHHHHHYHRHDHLKQHRHHSCPQCEKRTRANSHTSSTVLTDSATVNTSVGRTSSQQRRMLLLRAQEEKEGKRSYRHRHSQHDPLVTEDNQLHLKQLVIDQLSRDYTSHERHEHDACSFDDPVLASRLVVESLTSHGKHHHRHHHRRGHHHERRAHSEGSKHRLEKCMEEGKHHGSGRWKTEAFLLQAGDKSERSPPRNSVDAFVTEERQLGAEVDPCRPVHVSARACPGRHRPENFILIGETLPSQGHYLEHERDCPKNPRFFISYDSGQLSNPQMLSYMDKFARKRKKNRESKHSRHSKNRKHRLTKKFLTLSAEAIGWKDDASLESDSTSQTSRQAHDSDDLEKSTSTSDDHIGYPIAAWPEGAPDSKKAATWPRVAGKDKVMSGKPVNGGLPEQSLPVSDFVRMWLENGCHDHDSELTDAELGVPEDSKQTGTKKGSKRHNEKADSRGKSTKTKTKHKIRSLLLGEPSNKTEDIDQSTVSHAPKKLAKTERKSVHEESRNAAIHKQAESAEIPIDGPDLLAAYGTATEHSDFARKDRTLPSGRTEYSVAAPIQTTTDTTDALRPQVSLRTSRDITVIDNSQQYENECFPGSENIHSRTVGKNRVVKDAHSVPIENKPFVDSLHTRTAENNPRPEKGFSDSGENYPLTEIPWALSKETTRHPKDALLFVSEYKSVDEAAQVPTQKHQGEILTEKLNIGSVSLDVHESLV